MKFRGLSDSVPSVRIEADICAISMSVAQETGIDAFRRGVIFIMSVLR